MLRISPEDVEDFPRDVEDFPRISPEMLRIFLGFS